MQYNSKDSFLANQLKCKNKLKYFQLSRSEFKKLYTFMSNSNLLQIFIKKTKNKTKRNGASFAKAAFCYNVNNNKSLSAKLAGLQSAYKKVISLYSFQFYMISNLLINTVSRPHCMFLMVNQSKAFDPWACASL